MLKQTLIEFFTRDLEKLREEISAYPDEQSLWKVEGAIANSAGNLCLHLVGNLNHFIGAVLGKTGYKRDRDSEFSTRNIPKAELNARVKDTIDVVQSSLNGLPDADLEKVYPLEWNNKNVTTGYMLTHLVTHLNYHLGQVNYHRRILSAGKT